LHFPQDAPEKKIPRGSAGVIHQHVPEKRISKVSAGVIDQHKQIDSHSTSGGAKSKGMSYQTSVQSQKDSLFMVCKF